MSKPRILVIGEALVDIVRESAGAHVEHVGGSPANVAVGLARLDHPVRFATALGADQRGERIADHLARQGVKLAKRSVTEHPTSTAQVTFDTDHNATYAFDIHWNLAPVKVGKRDVHIHAGSLATALEPGATPAREAMTTHRESATVSYDPNIRPGIMGDLDAVRVGVEELLPAIDVVKASSDDIGLLYPDRPAEDVIDHWLSLGPALVVLTRGAEGVTYRTRTGEPVTLPTTATTVVDTVGAGDSFMAGLLSGLLSLGFLGGPQARAALGEASVEAVRPAIERGLACSAVTVGYAGAYAPSLDEL
ncbi:MAG: PfkB family carbohydrate kinase [Dermatophilaceae bacterium]|nr:PfkB family carbohydrate kinase [Intrasporangiaceae bacterium]